MRRAASLAVSVLALGVLLVLPKTGFAADGKDLFLQHKCSTCHPVAAAGIEAKIKSVKAQGPDLGAIDLPEEAWIAKFLAKQETAKDGKHHPKKYELPPADLTAIVAWLGSLHPAK